MNVIDAITQRRSHRNEYINRPIAEMDLNMIIEAARWAPSPFNVQPWSMILIRESEGKNTLADMTEQAIQSQFKDTQFLADNSQWMRINETEWQEHGDGVLLSDHISIPKYLENSSGGITVRVLKGLLNNRKALSIIGRLGGGKEPARQIATEVREAPLLAMITMDNERCPPGESANRWMLLSVGMLIQNMLLTATSLGIGVQFVSAPIERESDRNKIRQLFNIPQHHEVITLLRMGYVENEGNSSVRLDQTEIVHYEKYENKTG